MATVKSLEERIDDIADDLSAVKITSNVLAASMNTLQGQLANLVNGSNALQAQIAASNAQLSVVTARLDNATGDLNKTNGRIDTLVARVDAFTNDFASFRGKTENSFAVAKWAVAFAAGVFITVLGGGIALSREVSKIDGRLEQQQKSQDQLQRSFEQQQKTLDEIRSKLK